MIIRRMVLVTVGIALCGGATAQAQWIGATTGTAAFLTTSNWNSNIINSDFSGVTIGSGETLTLGVATSSTLTNTTFLNFDFKGAGNLVLAGTAATGATQNRVLTLGSANFSFQPKNVDNTAATGKTLVIGNVVSGTTRYISFSGTAANISRTFTVSAGNFVTHAGSFQQTPTIVKDGAGKYTNSLGTGNNYNLSVEAGTFEVTANSFNSSGRSITVGSSGTFSHAPASTGMANASFLNINGGNVSNSGPWSGITLSSTGGGTLTNSSSFTLAADVSYVAGGAEKTLTLGGSGGIALGGNRTFTVANGTQATDVDVTGVLSGAFSVTKQGAGVMRLGGINTYTGPTTATLGVLLVDGSTAAGSAVSVASGAVFGGDGTVNGNLTLANGALFAFDVGDTLTLGAGSAFALNSSFGVASLRDRLGAAVDWANVDAGTYQLITGGNLTAGFFDATKISNFGLANAVPLGGKNVYFDNGSLQLVVVPVPEPSAVLLGGFGLVFAGWMVRRRR